VPRVRVCVDLPEEHYRAFEAEARRRGVTVEALVEQTVQGLIEELEREESEGTDHPIFLE
jgi:hypothetical protein